MPAEIAERRSAAEETLGARTLSLRRPQSAYLSTALGGADISVDPWLEGPLLLEAGRPDDMLPSEDRCSATLRLRDDAVLGFHDPIQDVVCIRLFAAGSEGFIDCDGGRSTDVDVTIDSHGAGEAGELLATRVLPAELAAHLLRRVAQVIDYQSSALARRKVR